MIFATIGTQEPFDRFIQALDQVAPLLGDEPLVVQGFSHDYTPQHFQMVQTISPEAFASTLSQARLVVAHAGMGTILSALQADTPIIIYPRKLEFGEHRNDHQMATARQLERQGWVHVAHDDQQLRQLMTIPDLPVLHHIGKAASAELGAFLAGLA